MAVPAATQIARSVAIILMAGNSYNFARFISAEYPHAPSNALNGWLDGVKVVTLHAVSG
jgi:hypothetical protein